MSEEIKEEEKTKGKVRKVNKKRVLGAIGTGIILIGSIVGVVKYVNYENYSKVPEIEQSISDVVYIKRDETIFDELYMNSPMYLVDELEISSSEYGKLSKLDLDKYYTEDLISQEISLDKTELSNLVDRYNELKGNIDYKTPNADTNEFYAIVGKLYSCREQFSKDIYIDGVSLINDISVKYIKSLIIDSLGLTINDISNIDILPFYNENKELLIKYTDLNSGKVYYLDPSNNSLLNRLINNLINLNELNDKYLRNELKNIDKLASQEDVTLQNLKACILCNYEIKNGVIIQKETCKELVKKLD